MYHYQYHSYKPFNLSERLRKCLPNFELQTRIFLPYTNTIQFFSKMFAFRLEFPDYWPQNWNLLTLCEHFEKFVQSVRITLEDSSSIYSNLESSDVMRTLFQVWVSFSSVRMTSEDSSSSIIYQNPLTLCELFFNYSI